MNIGPTARPAVRICRFGVYEVDLERNELRKLGLRLKLEPKPLQLLIALLAHPGEVVTRNELHKLLWGEGVFVDFEKGLTVAVTKLRAALNDSSDNPKYIATVQSAGYRFIAPVQTFPFEPPPTLYQQSSGGPTEIPDRRELAASDKDWEHSVVRVEGTRKLKWALVIVAMALLAGLGFLLPTKANRVGPGLQAVHPGNVFARRFVYVVDYSGNMISGHLVNASTGLLEPLNAPSIKSGEHPYQALISPDQEFLYVANRGRADGACGNGCNVSGFAIDQINGALSELQGSPVPAGSGPVALAMHPSGKFLYVVNVISNDLYVYARAEDGRLSRFGPAIPVGRHPFYVTVSRSGRFLYVSNQDDATISGFAIDDLGHLRPVPGSPFRTGLRPRAVVIDPRDRFTYVVNHGVNPYLDKNAACSGTFAHVQGTGCTISVFAVEPATGSLTEIKGSPFDSGGTNPVSATIDSYGRYLFVGNFTSGNISVFHIDDETGSLQSIAGSPFPSVDGPISVAFDSGGFLYVVNAYSRNITQFEFNPANGELFRLRDLPTENLAPADIVAQHSQLHQNDAPP